MCFVVVGYVEIVPLYALLEPKEGLLFNRQSIEDAFLLKNDSRDHHQLVFLGVSF